MTIVNLTQRRVNGVRKAKPPRTAIPSAQEAYKKYKKNNEHLCR